MAAAAPAIKSILRKRAKGFVIKCCFGIYSFYETKVSIKMLPTDLCLRLTVQNNLKMFFLNLFLVQAYVRVITCSIPDHHNKAKISVKQVLIFFCWWRILPSICKKMKTNKQTKGNICEVQKSEPQ